MSLTTDNGITQLINMNLPSSEIGSQKQVGNTMHFSRAKHSLTCCKTICNIGAWQLHKEEG